MSFGWRGQSPFYQAYQQANPQPRPYDPSNGGQNANNFAPGGYYNPTGAYPVPGAAPPAQIGGGLPQPGLIPPPAHIGGGMPQPIPSPRPVPMPVLGLPPQGGNMGPNFGGFGPGPGGVGTPPVTPPRFGMGGGSYAMQGRPRPMPTFQNWNQSPLLGVAQRLLSQVSRPAPPSQPIGWMGRASHTWE